MKAIPPIAFFVIMLAGGIVTSCKHYPVIPPDTVKCDTCCDTCKTDTNKVPCDTCNIDKDSAAHAFVWTEYTIPSESDISGVWVFGPNDIILNGARLWHFDGTTFEDLHPIRNGSNTAIDGLLSGSSIFAFSATEFWLVSGSVAFHTTDGKYFDDIRPGNVNACWGSAPNDVFIVGNSGHIAHYDGTKFEDMTSGTTKKLSSVWGTSHNNVWASGANTSTGETVILHYDGTTWNIDNLTNTQTAKLSGLFAVWACDSNGHKFTVTSGSNIYRSTDNGIWRNDTGTIPNSLGGGSFVGLYKLSGNTASDFMAAGGWGWVGHWNGKTWMRYNQLYKYGNPSFTTGALSFKNNTACVVGEKSGKSWIAVGRRK